MTNQSNIRREGSWKRNLLRRQRDVDNPPAVGEVLRSAAAPGSAAELKNEDLSVAMFHSAHLDSQLGVLATSRRDPMVTPTKASKFAFKTIIAGVAAVTFGSAGIALAASGHLPGTNRAAEQHVVDHGPKIEPSDDASDPDGDLSDDPRDGSTEIPDESESPSDGSTDEATAPASYTGLCRAISVGNKDEHGKSLEAPPFAQLIETAGGIDNVPAFCEALLGPDTKPTNPAHPEHSHPAHPDKTDHPTKPEHTKHTHPAHPDKSNHPSHPGKSDHPGKP